MQDHPVDRLLRLHIGGGIHHFRLFRPVLLEVGDEAGQRVVAAVEDQIVGQCPLFLVDLGVGDHVGRVDDRHVEAGLDAVVEKDRVERRAGRPIADRRRRWTRRGW